MATKAHMDCLLLPCALLTTNSKRPIIHPKWTTGRQRGAEDAFFITHLQSFACLIVMQEQQRSLESPTGQTNDRPVCSEELS